MKKLTDSEYTEWLNEDIAVIHFMGGCAGSPENGEIVLVGDDILYFTQLEVGNEEYQSAMKRQRIEANEYFDTLECFREN